MPRRGAPPLASLLLWALATVLVCWSLDPRQRPLVGDNQLYFYLAERAASGVPPHVSHVDPKHQLGVLATAGAIVAGRKAGVDDVVSSRAASIAAASAAVALAGVAATMLARTALAGHVAAAALLATGGFADHASVGSNPKVFLVLFVLLAQVALARGRVALAGVAAGAAFLCWQPALLVVAAAMLEAAFGPRGGAAKAVRMLGWALLPVAAYELYFLASGAAAEQLWQNWVMTLGSVHELPRAWRSLAFVIGGGRGAAVPRVAAVCLLALAASATVSMLRSPRAAVVGWRSRSGLVGLAGGAAGATLFTLYDHQGVPDLFFPAPYFAIAAGLVAAAVSARVATAAPRAAAPAVAMVFLAALAAEARREPARRSSPGYDLDDQRRLAGVLRSEHEAGRSVWAYGAVHLLGLAHLDNHVPYALFFDDVASVLDVKEYRPLRDGRLPELIVQGRRRFPEGATYLRESYRPATTGDFAAQGLRLWRLGDDGPARFGEGPARARSGRD